MRSISFAGDSISPDLVPVEELADCAAAVLETDGSRILSYGTGAGYTPLRELIAEWFGVHPFRVVLTNGLLQGIGLLADERIRSSNVVIEYPTYDAMLQLCFSSGANLLYVDIHPEGPNIEGLEVALRTSQKPSLAYTMPTFQNPTTQSMTEEERHRFCLALFRAGVPTIEDDSYGLLRYEGDRRATMFEITGQVTIYATSFSHTISPGLRVGVLILPNDLALEISTKANSRYITPVLLSQATVYEFLRRERFDPHLEQLNAALKERRDLMIAALEKHLPEASFVRPEGGLFILAKLPLGTNTKTALDGAEGVTAHAGADFGGAPNTVRLNFAEPAVEDIEPGIERLAAALRSALPAD